MVDLHISTPTFFGKKINVYLITVVPLSTHATVYDSLEGAPAIFCGYASHDG